MSTPANSINRRPPVVRCFRSPRDRYSRSCLCIREGATRLWIPFELSSTGRGRQSLRRELCLFEGDGDSFGTKPLSIFVTYSLWENIQAKVELFEQIRRDMSLGS